MLLFDFLVSSNVSLLMTSRDLGVLLRRASEDTPPLASATGSVAVLVPSSLCPGFPSAVSLCPRERQLGMAKAAPCVSEVCIP